MNYHLRPRGITYVFITLVFLLWPCALILRAADRYVVPPGTPGGTNTGAFTSWSIAATQIQWAVDAATAAGDTVWVTNGTYNLTNRITISRAITNRSVNGPTATFINGNWPAYSNGCFTLQAQVYLTGFTITNGYAITNSGGGIEIAAAGANSVVSNCVVAGNTCYYSDSCGGGIALMASGAIVANCTISNNTVNSTDTFYEVAQRGTGGGVWLNQGTLVNSLVITNTASYSGGGVFVKGGVVTNCVIVQNRSSGSVGESGGGGVYINSSLPSMVINCTLIGNAAVTEGGAVKIKPGSIWNCTIISNKSSSAGGVMIQEASALYNCLIARNTGMGVRIYNGASMYNCTVVSNSGTGVQDANWGYNLTTNSIYNCIVMDNTAGNIPVPGYGIFLKYTCSTPLPAGEGNIANNPQFVAAASANYRLTATSPCVNTGTNQSWMTNAVDLDGRRRILYVTVDMGAYERINQGTIFKFQ